MGAAGWFSSVGLILDVLGASVLVVGTLRARGAAIRALANVPDFERGHSRLQVIAIWLARRFGSTDVRLTTPDMIGDFSGMLIGTGLLVLGFVGQLIGQVLQVCK